MEDFILREIDRLYDVLMLMAQKLGLWNGKLEKYGIADLKREFEDAKVSVDLDELLKMENPVWYLVNEEHLSDKSLEIFIDILYHTDLDASVKTALLNDTLAYFEHKKYVSFRLYSLLSAK